MATKYLGSNALLYLLQLIKPKFDNKVDKVTGKGLSTNDYTTAEKTKLSGIEASAQVNVIETVKVNGTAQTISSKAVNITVPTKTSALTNDSGFITSVPVDSVNGDIGEVETTKLVHIDLSGIEEGATGTSDTSSEEIATLLNNGFAVFATADVGINKDVVLSLVRTTPNPTFSGTYYDDDTADDIRFIQVQVQGTTATVDSYFAVADRDQMLTMFNNVEAQIPTKTSQLVNDMNFATQTYVQEAISGISGITYAGPYDSVDDLPATGAAGTIYLVSKTAETKDVYLEYIWFNSAYELIGTTSPDLSDYVKTTDLVELTNEEVQAVWDLA